MVFFGHQEPTGKIYVRVKDSPCINKKKQILSKEEEESIPYSAYMQGKNEVWN